MSRYAATRSHSRPFRLAALFLFVNGLALTLAPTVRARSWQAPLRLGHWPVLLIWWLTWRRTLDVLARRGYPLRPAWIAALLTGWGMLNIARLSTYFGWRQAAWLAVALGMLVLLLHYLPPDLAPLRRRRTLWLSGGLLLTAATLVFGTNPAGDGLRLWLGCCGLYFQPSEPLKLLLVVYLAAYLAERASDLQNVRSPLLRLIAPTALMTALAIAILIAQRDLGTASLILALYAVMVYLATGSPRILGGALIALAGSAGLGYRLFDVVRLRVDAWLNPWADPGGRGYQIIQALIAIANGGLPGRGPGLGNPALVPVAHSDFIFTTIAEEYGLVGTWGLMALLLMLTWSGLAIARRQSAPFPRLLAGGLSAFFGGQSLLILGGNLRLLPLTGVTLPFVSYGGSSLLTAHLALGLLLACSRHPAGETPSLLPEAPLRLVRRGLTLAFAAAALLSAWWGLVRAPTLIRRTDNLRRDIAARVVPRGDIRDRYGRPLAVTEGPPGDFTRRYPLPTLGPVLGYTHPRFGMAGLEAALDGVLRGEDGQPWWRVALHRLLYGTPPPGLAVRLTLEADLQARVDDLLGDRAGAVVILDAASGAIRAMASHPTFNANRLSDIAPALMTDPRAPLLNRATQARYPAAALLRTFGLPTPTGLEVAFRLPQAAPAAGQVTPLQAALLVAAAANHGIRPAPYLVRQIGDRAANPLDTPRPLPVAVLTSRPWQAVFDADGASWFVAVTDAPTPTVLVLVLEEHPPRLARTLGAELLALLR